MVFITKQKAVLYMGSDEKCYSKKISEFYPGEHERVDLSK
jgi:hypothetical protein